MRELTYKEAASQLNVTQATVRNWTRQGIISVGKQLNPLESEISEIKNRIISSDFGRLSSRANKSSATRKFIPTEYIENNRFRKKVKTLANQLQILVDDQSTILFAISLYLVKRKGLLKNSGIGIDSLTSITHKKLSMELNHWYDSLKNPPSKELYKWISKLSIPIQRDTTGLFYQMLQSEGRKSEKGSYYTPPSYADGILKKYGRTNQRFLDPCCGTGIFLLAAAKKYGNPRNIYGWDTDEIAVQLARINLMLYFKEIQFEPNVFLRNGLLYETTKKYDLIATNPPWGHHFPVSDQKKLDMKYDSIKTGESFSYFVEAGLNLLGKNGQLCYILPEALLKVKTHIDIRKVILDKGKINYLKYLGKPFDNVQTEVIRMDMQFKNNDSKAKVFRNEKVYSVNTTRFKMNNNYLFDFNCNRKDYRIIRNIYRKRHSTLKEKTEWILGIVTGNNDKYLSFNPDINNEPIICGQDIIPFKIKEPGKFIYFNKRELQQCAPKIMYEKNPKIVYRFISEKPVFAIDRNGSLSLNSANSFCTSNKVPIEIIVALFNSKLYQFIFRKKFNTVKILRSHLEQLPILKLNENQTRRIRELSEKIEKSSGNQYMDLREELDDIIFKYCRISEKDKMYILESL